MTGIHHLSLMGLRFVFIGLSAYLSASTAGILIGAMSRLPVETVPQSISAAGAGAAQRFSVRDFGASLRRNLFGASVGAVEGVLGAGEVSDARAESLPIQLVGVWAADNPAQALATISDMQNRTTRLVAPLACRGLADMQAPCEKVAEHWRLLRVEPRGIVVENTETAQQLAIELNTEAASPGERPSATSHAGPPVGASLRVRTLDDGTVQVSRQDLDVLLKDPMQLGARVVPRFENGALKGHALFSIRPGSPLSLLGLHNGDVIQGVNGYRLDDPNRLLELYQKLSSESSFTVDLERQGARRSLSYRVWE